MQEINLNKIEQNEIEMFFNTPRLDKMFWTVRNYSFNDIPSYEAEAVLKRLSFSFSVSFPGNGRGSIFVRDLKTEKKYLFKY